MIKGCCSTMFYSLSLSAALTVRLAFSKRNVRPEVCVLYSSTQIRLVPDLANINNSLERDVCEQGCNSLLFEHPREMQGVQKVGQSGKIRLIGCKKKGGKFRIITGK